MNLFYVQPEDISLPGLVLQNREAAHAVKVLRHREGDILFATDGQGTCFECVVKSVRKNRVYLEVLRSRLEEKPAAPVTILIGLIKKKDRLEFAAEKVTELGVDKIIIFRGDRSQTGKVRLDRLRSSAMEAMKQSLRYYLPVVEFYGSLDEALRNHCTGETTLIAADETSADIVIPPGAKEKARILLVGPEGGFSEDERRCWEIFGGIPYSLGPKRLRTETAAICMADRFSPEAPRVNRL